MDKDRREWFMYLASGGGGDFTEEHCDLAREAIEEIDMLREKVRGECVDAGRRYNAELKSRLDAVESTLSSWKARAAHHEAAAKSFAGEVDALRSELREAHALVNLLVCLYRSWDAGDMSNSDAFFRFAELLCPVPDVRRMKGVIGAITKEQVKTVLARAASGANELLEQANKQREDGRESTVRLGKP